MQGIVLIMSAVLSDGTTLMSPAFTMNSYSECTQRGARIVSQYQNVPDISSMHFRCYKVKDSYVIDPTKCQE